MRIQDVLWRHGDALILAFLTEACSVTVASGIFRAEAWGQGSRERDSSRCLIPAGGGRGPARPTAGGRTDGARIRGEGYRTPNGPIPIDFSLRLQRRTDAAAGRHDLFAAWTLAPHASSSVFS